MEQILLVYFLLPLLQQTLPVMYFSLHFLFHVSTGSADLLACFFHFFSPHLLYFWSGNPVLLGLVDASLPQEFSMLSSLQFSSCFLTGNPPAFLLAQTALLTQHLLQSCADITYLYYYYSPLYKTFGCEVIVCGSCRDNDLNRVIFHTAFTRASFASSRAPQ